ncbi:MAG: hypothetical protein ACOX3H_08625 [Saccharofermentanales bacterium]
MSRNPQDRKFWHGKSGFRKISGFAVPKKPALWGEIRRTVIFGRMSSDFGSPVPKKPALWGEIRRTVIFVRMRSDFGSPVSKKPLLQIRSVR